MLKFYGQFEPPVDQILYERYFHNKTGGISIEAGACDGILENCTYFFNKNFGWKTINIEPLPNVYEILCANRTGSNNINLNIGLSDKEEIRTIRNYRHPQLGFDWGNASFEHTPSHKEMLENLSQNVYVEHEVQCKTYKQLIEELKIPYVDCFVLDVEGYEKYVIEGMKDCDVLPEVFVIEHGHQSPEIIKNMIKDLNCQYKLDFMHAVNSFFVKDK